MLQASLDTSIAETNFKEFNGGDCIEKTTVFLWCIWLSLATSLSCVCSLPTRKRILKEVRDNVCEKNPFCYVTRTYTQHSPLGFLRRLSSLGAK
jgi:hypothetical protein